MYELQISTENTFESIKHINDNGTEFWYARELMPLLEYIKWQNFKIVIDKAIISCKNSSIDYQNHFTDVSKMAEIGS